MTTGTPALIDTTGQHVHGTIAAGPHTFGQELLTELWPDVFPAWVPVLAEDGELWHVAPDAVSPRS